nr:hypothetical protein [Leekyejoonella antrihumi]
MLGVATGCLQGGFGLLLLGAALMGFAAASTAQSRYAATDLARPQARAAALSATVWAGAVGAVAGPNLVGPAGGFARGIALPSLTGSLVLSAATMAGAAAIVQTGLRPDPLVATKLVAHRLHAALRRGRWCEVVAVLRGFTGVRTGVLALCLGHAVMIGVMVMAPILLRQDGATLNVISGHVAACTCSRRWLVGCAIGWAAGHCLRQAARCCWWPSGWPVARHRGHPPVLRSAWSYSASDGRCAPSRHRPC